MAGLKHRPTGTQTSEEDQGSTPGEEPGRRELRRLAESFESHWQDLLRDRERTTDPDCVRLLDIAYATADLQNRAQDMRLDFLGYLLGMALQETLEQLRATEPRDHPRPTAR